MHQEMLNLIVRSAREQLRPLGLRLGGLEEQLLRSALQSGYCVQITVPDPSVQRSCPVAVVGNEADSRVWFSRNGVEDHEMRRRFDEPIIRWVTEQREKRRLAGAG